MSRRRLQTAPVTKIASHTARFKIQSHCTVPPVSGWWTSWLSPYSGVNLAKVCRSGENSDAGPTSKASPEVEPAPAKPEQDDRSARLDELLARADQAARRLAAQQAERQASSEYAARTEREAQAQPEAGRQAEARDQAEIEM